jgi:anaerobic ribonucleoside-triphosphate reductase activating protein
MEIRVSGVVNDSIVDGPGLRLSVFTQGCPHHCEGCHNPQSHDFAGGTLRDTADILAQAKKNPLLDGVTLTGGEPFCQPEACLEIAKGAHALNLNVWAFSGYSYEELLALAPALLNEIDVLVDGPFVLAERSLELRFRGSRNQRLIDMKKTRAAGEVILWEAPQWVAF